MHSSKVQVLLHYAQLNEMQLLPFATLSGFLILGTRPRLGPRVFKRSGELAEQKQTYSKQHASYWHCGEATNGRS